jgi:hypothetical protein
VSTLENPSVGAVALYPNDESVKDDLLAQALQILPLFQRSLLEAILQGLPEGCCIVVSSRRAHR